MTDQMLSRVFNKAKPYLAMVSLQFGYAGMYIITMVSMKHGLSNWVFVVYRHVVATIVMTPFALVLERKVRPKLTLKIFLKIALLGFLEPVLDQNLYFLGMKYTSATFAAATVNVLPAVTFIMAIIFRLEKINVKKVHSLAKVIGTAITVSGAMVLTLYKGPIVDIFGQHGSSDQHKANTGATDQHWVTGTIMLLSCTGGWAGYFIVQKMVIKEYPAELSLTALVCLMGMIETAIAALIMERDMGAWAIGFDSRLISSVYSGVVCSGIAYYVQSAVNKIRGPVFVTAFSPLSMVVTALLGAIVLGDQIHLGSLIGAIIVVFGLYSVVWGKCKDQSALDMSTSDNEKAHKLPVVDKTRSVIFDVDIHGIDEPVEKSKKAARTPQPEDP